MHLDQIRARVEEIRFMEDDEMRHIKEDELQLDFIKWVSRLNSELWPLDRYTLAEKARLVASTSEIPYTRGYNL